MDEELNRTIEEGKRLKSWFSGFMLGLLGCFVICCLVVFPMVLKSNKELRKQLEDDTPKYVTGLEFELDTNKLNQMYEIIKNYYLEDYTDEQIVEGIYKGMMESLGDPYTVYYNKEDFDSFMESGSGQYCGIGVVVSQNITDYTITVSQIFEKSPAAEIGMQVGDIITKVAGKEIGERELSIVVKDIRGEAGTKALLEVYRPSDGKTYVFEPERRVIETPSATGKMLEDGIGLVTITSFEETTAKQYKAAMEELKAQGMKAVIIDLRNNGGGLLSSVCDILDQILPKGVVVSMQEKNGKVTAYECDGLHELDIPMVVLINGFSASASEIFAGAVSDYEKATLIGTKTYGKGIVQTIRQLNGGDGVKITISKYFTPKGRDIHKVGIEPDIEVTDVSQQLEKAKEVIKEKMN